MRLLLAGIMFFAVGADAGHAPTPRVLVEGGYQFAVGDRGFPSWAFSQDRIAQDRKTLGQHTHGHYLNPRCGLPEPWACKGVPRRKPTKNYSEMSWLSGVDANGVGFAPWGVQKGEDGWERMQQLIREDNGPIKKKQTPGFIDGNTGQPR